MNIKTLTLTYLHFDNISIMIKTDLLAWVISLVFVNSLFACYLRKFYSDLFMLLSFI